MKPIATPLVHRVLVPRESKAETHPTMIMLHGRGADEDDLLGLSSYLDPRLLVLSARAPYDFPYSGGYMWYVFSSVGAPDPEMFKTSYEKLVTFVNDAIPQYPVDRKRVFLLGFSMGTVMSYALSLTHPQLFRGVIANSGYVPEGTFLSFKWHELAHLDILIAHGTMDPVIPVHFARRARELLSTSNARVTYKEYPMAHQISEASLADMSAWLSERLTP